MALIGLLSASCWSPPRLMSQGVAPLDPVTDRETPKGKLDDVEASRDVTIRLYLLRTDEEWVKLQKIDEVWSTGTEIPDSLKNTSMARPLQATLKVGSPVEIQQDFLDKEGKPTQYVKEVKYVGVVANFQNKAAARDWLLLVPTKDLYDRLIKAKDRKLETAPKVPRAGD